MNVRTINTYEISVTDPQRAWRFYHEVFDLPDAVLTNGLETVSVAGKNVIFRQVPAHDTHVDLDHPDLILRARDRINDLINHLQNYYVPIVAGPTPEDDLQAIFVNDYEGNLIKILERAK
ncbi:VOC family protein [Furfurilactobacillus curtus]|uniref:Glyoxalase n=1 Tax=Furfurilactobacillus curtus TaxID=1746200 RepID=A0ABQ5JT08_9LACO